MKKWIIRIVAAVVICGSASASDFSGGWSGRWSSDNETSGWMATDLSQSGNSITGTLNLQTAMYGNRFGIPLTGSLSGHTATLTGSLTEKKDVYRIQYTQAVLSGDGSTASGNYTITENGRVWDSGTFTMNRSPSVLEHSSWMVFEGSVRIQRIDPEGGRGQETPAMVREAGNCVLVINRANPGADNALLIQWDKNSWAAQPVTVQIDASGRISTKRDRKTGLLVAERTLCSLRIQTAGGADLLIGPFDGTYGYTKDADLNRVQQRASLNGAGFDPASFACRTGRLRLNQTAGNALDQAADSAGRAQVLSQLIKKMPTVPGLAERLDGTFGSMVLIPGGTNAGTDPDYGAYSLTVEAFYMDATEVTKAQWDEVYTWAISNGYSFDNAGSAGSGKGSNHPVHTVNWHDCVKWCNARSEKDGRIPVYTVGGNVYRTGQTTPDQNTAASGYRLPTLAEWEYAARGGLSGKRFPWGDTITHSQANYYSHSYYIYDSSPTRGDHPTYATGSHPYTSPVWSFAANGYGLYDMAGNVWEWCWDTSGSNRGVRGGGWNYDAGSARCGDARWRNPVIAYFTLGFRSVCR